jgi:signal transduction histidine kinase
MVKSDRQTQRLLLLGFGGVLLLLAFTGLNALYVMAKIQKQSEMIREDYFNRDRILEQLRSDVYLSGTYVRDLLLEPDAARADVHKQELEETRERVKANVARYNGVLRNEERGPFREFAKEVQSYFDSLRPALEWSAGQRKMLGYAFMKNSLLPRRMTVVNLADQIGSVNHKQIEAGNRDIANLFSNFRRSVTLLLVLTLVCGALLAGLSIRRILRLERLSVLRFEEVEHARAALRDLSARLIDVQESDRRSLSRELHDEIGQSLSALLLGIGNVAAVLPSAGSGEAYAQLHELRQLAERTVAEVRDMSLLLRPSMLDDLGLIPAVQWQAREISRTNNVSVQVDAGTVSENIPDEYRTCIYRIVQEALRNVVRHANAKNVRIRLKQSADELTLAIQDDGQGFVPDREKGLGLLGMEERVRHLHGSFRIDSTPGVGTSIRVELPFSEDRVIVAT